MSDQFREYVRKIGSGPHTGKNLTRIEAAHAMAMMLRQEATPAQIGAFFIAHRIKRPTGEELAGMLDTYNEFGPKIAAIHSDRPVWVISSPYDGRNRTFPLTVITALVLASAGQPVLLHGSSRTPTKEGITLQELWQGLGVNWTKLDLTALQTILQNTGLGFVYTPVHFPQTQSLVGYRREIGKRPPIATLELIWCPYAGASHIVVGYVHPPTEGMIREAFKLHNIHQFTTFKGLEGSCDLPRERTGIMGVNSSTGFERLYLHPHEYGFAGKNPAMPLSDDVCTQLMQALLQPNALTHPPEIQHELPEIRRSLLWNSGFYLWHCSLATSLEQGTKLAEELIDSGQVAAHLQDLQQTIARCRAVN
jgi:anthranilate phosphoribosyltransferase